MRCPPGAALPLVRLPLLSHIDQVALPLDTPAGDRVERRRTQHLASAQAETSMVPRAANRIPDNQTLVQRTVVMGAGSANGEHLLAPSHQQDRLGPDMTEHHRTVRKLGKIEAAGQIGAARRGCSFGHGSVLPILNITSYVAAARSPVSSCEREAASAMIGTLGEKPRCRASAEH